MSEETKAEDRGQWTEGGRKPVVHLLATELGVDEFDGIVFVRGGVAVSFDWLARWRVLSVLTYSVAIILGKYEQLSSSFVLWTDADTPPNEWLRIDNFAPVCITAEQATDLLMIFDRALRLAGVNMSARGVPS